MDPVANVTTELDLRLVVRGGPSLPLTAGLDYRADDPWAVRVAFRTGGPGDRAVEWLFARQLLTEGIGADAGLGDVRVWPSEDGPDRTVCLQMASPSGSARFEIDRDALVEFLQQTYLAVPTGCEEQAVDLEHEFGLLLDDGV